MASTYFVLKKRNERRDTITDFKSNDLINLSKIMASAKFAADTPLQQFEQFVDLKQVNSNIEVRINRDGLGTGNRYVILVTLNNVQPNDISPSNFVI
ncbi:MAG: type I secretion C-terminal target domain-containing protein [Cyanobacteria bacterium P01_F01_bin.150]